MYSHPQPSKSVVNTSWKLNVLQIKFIAFFIKLKKGNMTRLAWKELCTQEEMPAGMTPEELMTLWERQVEKAHGVRIKKGVVSGSIEDVVLQAETKRLVGTPALMEIGLEDDFKTNPSLSIGNQKSHTPNGPNVSIDLLSSDEEFPSKRMDKKFQAKMKFVPKILGKRCLPTDDGIDSDSEFERNYPPFRSKIAEEKKPKTASCLQKLGSCSSKQRNEASDSFGKSHPGSSNLAKKVKVTGLALQAQGLDHIAEGNAMMNRNAAKLIDALEKHSAASLKLNEILHNQVEEIKEIKLNLAALNKKVVHVLVAAEQDSTQENNATADDGAQDFPGPLPVDENEEKVPEDDDDNDGMRENIESDID